MNAIYNYEQETATNILKQLGGNKFIAITGAKNFVYGKRKETGNIFIGFRFPMCRHSNYCSIELNSLDLYDMTFQRIRKYDAIVTKEYKSLYCDQLQEIFTGYTALNTHL